MLTSVFTLFLIVLIVISLDSFINTLPKSFKYISVKGILLVLVIFAITIWSSIIVIYHMPLHDELIADATISFLGSVTFLFAMKHRDEVIKTRKDEIRQIAKWYNKNIPRLLFFWAGFYILLLIFKKII